MKLCWNMPFNGLGVMMGESVTRVPSRTPANPAYVRLQTHHSGSPPPSEKPLLNMIW